MLEQQTNNINKNKQYNQHVRLLDFVMQKILMNLLAEFKNQNYDGNRILRVVYQMVKAQKESKEKQQVLELWQDIQIVVWSLSTSPKYIIQMFNNQQFYSTSQQIVDMHVFTNKIYTFTLNKTKEMTKHAKIIFDAVSPGIFIFLQQVNRQICQCYTFGRLTIMKETKHLQQLVKNSPIINFYLLYKLLLEVSVRCEALLIDYFSTNLFRNIQNKYSQQFANYIIQKHQILELAFDSGSIKNSHEDSLADIMEKIQTKENLKWRQAIREDGQTGIIIQFQNEIQGKQADNYMIKMNKQGKLKVINCKTLRMKWQVTQAAQKNYQILNIVSDKNKIIEKLRNSPLKIKQISMTDQIGTFGGALGKCLADIRNYDSIGDFMFDLSKKSIINGTFNIIATNIPLIGMMFATGGYSFTLYSIFKNKSINKKKKFQQLGVVSVDIATSFGSGMVGAVVGQSLIPIPFLGAFVGGFVGGFIGEISGKALINKLQSMKFKQIINRLQITMKAGGYWQVNKQTLQILGLHRQNFYSSIPVSMQERLGSDKFWFALIGLIILCFHESKKRAKFIEEHLKQLKKQQQAQIQCDIIFDEIKMEMHYEMPISLMCIMKYLQINQIQLSYHYLELQEFITKLFARIK